MVEEFKKVLRKITEKIDTRLQAPAKLSLLFEAYYVVILRFLVPLTTSRYPSLVVDAITWIHVNFKDYIVVSVAALRIACLHNVFGNKIEWRHCCRPPGFLLHISLHVTLRVDVEEIDCVVNSIFNAYDFGSDCQPAVSCLKIIWTSSLDVYRFTCIAATIL